jgi:hypothetical protein
VREEGGAVFWFRFVTTDVYFFLLILAMREGPGGGVCVCVCVRLASCHKSPKDAV